VLKCEQGFVGYKSTSSYKLECNKATYETIQVERSEKGVVFFKGQYSNCSYAGSIVGSLENLLFITNFSLKESEW
jgi:fascin 1/2